MIESNPSVAYLNAGITSIAIYFGMCVSAEVHL